MAHGMTAVRQDPFARLDAWVLEELEALSSPRARPEERTRRRAEPEPEPARFEEATFDEGPLPVDENQFIQRVTEWLHGRPNADLILEEIWRNVVSPEDLGDELGEEAANAGTELSADSEGDDMGVDLSAEDEAPEGPADAADETPPAPQG